MQDRTRFETLVDMVTMDRVEHACIKNRALSDDIRDEAVTRYVNLCDRIVEDFGTLIDLKITTTIAEGL